MTLSDDILMRYADGELNAEDRAAVEASISDDADVARRLAEHQRLRQQLAEAYKPALIEPVPDRFAALFGRTGAREASIVDLAEVRARRGAPRWPAWAQASGMAACLAAGLVAGAFFLHGPPPPLAAGPDGRLSARGELAAALEHRLTSDPPAGRVSVVLSFASRDGRYCRTFQVRTNRTGGEDLAGLACRDASGWSLPIVVAQAAGAQAGPYRPAASAMAPAIVQAVDAMMAGDGLDAGQEASARAAGWRR